MKKSIQIVIISLSIILLHSCNKGNKSEPTESIETNVSENKAMTVNEAKNFLDADAANDGKEVTVTGFSWGSVSRVSGEVLLNLGDEKLEGFKQASFSCVFKKEEADVVKAIETDAMVTVTGKITKGEGGVELNDCKIIQ